MLSRSYGVMCFHVGRLLDSGTVAPSFRDLVTFVESHGTGTMLGDPIEANALGAVLGVGSLRSEERLNHMRCTWRRRSECARPGASLGVTRSRERTS